MKPEFTLKKSGVLRSLVPLSYHTHRVPEESDIILSDAILLINKGVMKGDSTPKGMKPP
jgi:hypothetical protein